MSDFNEDQFVDIALALFQTQAKENETYKKYLTYLGVNPVTIKTLEDVPFLPISFFKELDVKCGTWVEETTFLSSATTGAIPSKHRVKDLNFYLANAERIFTRFYGDLTEYHFLALLPSYLERENSSLVAMMNHFIERSGSRHSAFYLKNMDTLKRTLISPSDKTRKTILWGVSFALLELAESESLDLSDCIIMETGGMKGRRPEVTREELHLHLCRHFNVSSIHSEYGMTELFSQAYSSSQGYFKTPPWMKVMVRSINDPFQMVEAGKAGGLNVIDLSNIYTCAFVETQDLGRVTQRGSFEVLGRMDNSDTRGCNLLVE